MASVEIADDETSEITAETLPGKRKRNPLTEEAKAAKRESDRVRGKTRVNLGRAFGRWRELRHSKRFKTDIELAFFLLDYYERDHATSTPSTHTAFPPPPSSLSSSAADSDHDGYYEFASPGIQPVDEEEEVHVLQYSIKSTSIAEEEQLQDLDEEKANDLMNSVIDWEDETEYQEVTSGDDCLAEDGSSDEEFVPSVCVRTGGALPNPFPIDALPVIALDETVHDVPNLGPKSEDIPPFPEHEQVLCEDDLIDKHANITYDDHLHRLATFLQLPIQKCPYSNPVTGAECAGNPPFEVTMASRGTGTILEWFCPFGHSVWRWNSQPLLKFGIQAGDFMLSSNILLSGNNYTKIALLFKFMNMGMVADEAFLNIQDTYCVDAVKELWQEKRADVIGRLHSKDHVVVLGDCRMDSPGHCAQYCTYATIEQESRDIIHIVTVDKRDTNRKSVIMEKEAFIRTMDVLLQEIPVKEVVTDAHRQISALLNPERGKYKPWGLQHSLDIWHGAKNLAKKLHAAGLMKDQSAIMYWIKDIVNHFWYCCKQAKTEEQFKTMWQGVLHHVRDRHQWPFGSCDHGPLDDRSRDKPWMVQRSAAHQALTAIVLDEHWLKDVKKFLNFRTTSDLEAFKNHILMYAGKQFLYSPSIIEARILLAALDYNHHNHRAPALTHDGHKMNKRYYNKKSKRWSVYTMKVPKDYSYIPELQKIILKKQLKFGEGLPKKRPLEPDDPGRLGLVTEIPPPPTAELPRTQITRGEAVSPDGSDPVIPEVVAVIDEESNSSNAGDEVSGEGDMDSSDSDWDPSVDHNFLSEGLLEKDSNNGEEDLNNSPACFKRRQLCPECGRFFNNIKPHTCEYKIKPYSCNVCGKRCVSEHALKIHCKIHKEDYVHQCKFCLATFQTRLDKLAHEDAHPCTYKPYQCPDCSETFSNIRVRNKHLQDHRGPSRHNCRVCNMEFHNLSQLLRHTAVHTGVKPFMCEVCQRSFNQASHLKSHMRLHTGERPFKCLHCDKSFNHNVSLKSHVQRYHNQVPDFESKQLMEKKNKSEAEKDEMNEKESNTGDVEDREGSKKDSASEFNNLEEEEEEEEGEEEEEEEEEENKDTRTTIKTKRSTGRPKGRPKRNAGVRGVNLVFAVQAETQCQKTEAETCEMDQLNRTSCGSDESKGGQSDSYSAFDPTKNKRRKKMNSGRGRGRPKTSEVKEYDSDSDFDPAEKRKKKKSGDQNLKSTGRGRGRPKKNSVV